jgi:hypothetical protein
LKFTPGYIFIGLLSGTVLITCFAACSVDDAKAGAPPIDTIPPVMQLVGNAVDTAYLNGNYNDPQVRLLDEVNGELRCTNIKLETAGQVDTRFPGVYTITYTAKDDAGNAAVALTRTVHVVEGELAYLNGAYTVVCTCTAVERGSFTPTVTTETYDAAITPDSRKGCFDLNRLKVGAQFVKPNACLEGDVMQLHFYSAELHTSSSGSGTISSSKNSFTVETMVYQWSPPLNYICKSVFVQVKLPEIKNIH